MDLLHLVDRLEELVATAQKMPIGARAIVDRRRLLDIVDQMRVTIPGEVREAQEMVARRDAIRREAEEEARLIVARAEERAATLVEEHEIAAAARQRAAEIASDAEARLVEQVRAANADIEARIAESRGLAEQQMEAADEYARELLRRLERQLEAFARSIHSGIEQLAGPEHRAPSDAAWDAGSTPERSREPAPIRTAMTADTGAGMGGAARLSTDTGGEAVIDDFAMPALDDERWSRGGNGQRRD